MTEVRVAVRAKQTAARRDLRKPLPPRASPDTSGVLLEVMRSLTGERDLDALLQKIMQKTSEVMNADRSSMFLVDDE
jgi:hypothetical protein